MENYIPNIIGIGDFQKKASVYLKRLKGAFREGLLVSHNKPQAVLMSLDRYEELRRLEDEQARETEEVTQLIAKGDEEYSQKKTVKARSLKQFLD